LAAEVDGSFELDAVDATLSDGPSTDDQVDFTATFTGPDGKECVQRLLQVIPAGPDHSFFGGVGISAKLMPRVPAYVMALPILVGTALTGGLSYADQGYVPVEQSALDQLLLSPLRLAYGLLPLAALTLWFGVLTRSTVGALGGALAYALLGEGLLGDVFQMISGAPVGAYLPGGLASSLAIRSFAVDPARALPSFPVSEPLALLGIGAWTVVFLALTVWTFNRQVLTG
jgi:hypothetical protein